MRGDSFPQAASACLFWKDLLGGDSLPSCPKMSDHHCQFAGGAQFDEVDADPALTSSSTSLGAMGYVGDHESASLWQFAAGLGGGVVCRDVTWLPGDCQPLPPVKA